jgi:hypothetical protein
MVVTRSGNTPPKASEPGRVPNDRVREPDDRERLRRRRLSRARDPDRVPDRDPDEDRDPDRRDLERDLDADARLPPRLHVEPLLAAGLADELMTRQTD